MTTCSPVMNCCCCSPTMVGSPIIPGAVQCMAPCVQHWLGRHAAAPIPAPIMGSIPSIMGSIPSPPSVRLPRSTAMAACC